MARPGEDDRNGPLSQEEIDAVLKALGPSEEKAASEPAGDSAVSHAQTEPQTHALPPKEEPKEEQKEPSPEASAAARTDPSLARLYPLTMSLAVSIGETTMALGDLLTLGVGSRIVLNSEWRKPVALKLNGVPVGVGQVVLIGNAFGVKVIRWGRSR